MARVCNQATPNGPCRRLVAGRGRDCGVNHHAIAKTPNAVNAGGSRPPAVAAHVPGPAPKAATGTSVTIEAWRLNGDPDAEPDEIREFDNELRERFGTQIDFDPRGTSSDGVSAYTVTFENETDARGFVATRDREYDEVAGNLSPERLAAALAHTDDPQRRARLGLAGIGQMYRAGRLNSGSQDLDGSAKEGFRLPQGAFADETTAEANRYLACLTEDTEPQWRLLVRPNADGAGARVYPGELAESSWLRRGDLENAHTAEAAKSLSELDRHLHDLRGSFSNPGSGHAVGHRIASLAALDDPAVDAELNARFPHPEQISHPRWDVRVGLSVDGGFPNRSQSAYRATFAEAVRYANSEVRGFRDDLVPKAAGEARVAEVRPDYEGRVPIMHTASYTSREGFGEDRVHDFRDPEPVERPPRPKRLSYRERRAQIFGRTAG